MGLTFPLCPPMVEGQGQPHLEVQINQRCFFSIFLLFAIIYYMVMFFPGKVQEHRVLL